MNPDRREVLAALAALGIGPAVFHRAAATLAADPALPTTITPEMVQQAEWVASITLSDDDRKQVARVLTGHLRGLESAHKFELTNDVAPAVRFDPTPGVA